MKPITALLTLLALMLTPGCGTAPQGKGVGVLPQVRFQAKPQYPFEMRRAGINGEVLVEFIVDTQGVPQEVRAVKSSSPEFAPAAIAAVQKWRFQPGTMDGRPVNTRMTVPVIFALQEGAASAPAK